MGRMLVQMLVFFIAGLILIVLAASLRVGLQGNPWLLGGALFFSFMVMRWAFKAEREGR